MRLKNKKNDCNENYKMNNKLFHCTITWHTSTDRGMFFSDVLLSNDTKWANGLLFMLPIESDEDEISK